MSTSHYDILRRVQQLTHSAHKWSGTLYRNSSVRFANETDLLTGEGSFKFGGRWNPKGIPAVYASLTPEASMAEALANFRYYGWDIADAMPRLFVAIDASLERVLDLTDRSIRQRLGVSMQRILADDWRKLQHAGTISLTQMIGQAIATVGMDGLLTPCACDPAKTNLVWFPKNLDDNAKIVIRRADELPN